MERFEDAFKRSFKTTEDKEQEDKKLPELSEGQTFDGVQTKISEHYTTPPKHFTEDSLCQQWSEPEVRIWEMMWSVKDLAHLPPERTSLKSW